MPVTREEMNGLPQLRITGPLTAMEVLAVRGALLEALPAEGAVAIDAAGVTDCDTLGVQLLLSALKAENVRPVMGRLSPAVQEAAVRSGLTFRNAPHPKEEK